ncbi:DNA damage tolerance protein RHC31 [Beauveria bassiana]|uniref:Ubiquitin-like 1-activating enzyme E1A n=1 Tax=Beauveria bassiana TaxID=176275 RepID=A0A2N6P1Z3_BEABA|nr:DNA damage tolerance protein RHC31 [Beauveria bassiana]
MDSQQRQTSADAQAQPQAQENTPNANGAPPFDPSLLPQMPNPDAMAGIFNGHRFIADPNMAALPMGDPSMMLPLIRRNKLSRYLPVTLLFLPALEHSAAYQRHPKLTEPHADEIALYDRQIRLWGMAAQARIQNARILLITMRALANEVAKNLVLAGVGSLTILDDALVSEADLGAQFFQNDGGADHETHVGRNRAEAAAPALRKLNPRVQVHVDAEGVKSKGPSYFAGFDIVIATDLDPDSFNLINTATRINGKAFYAAGTHGMYGFLFSDLIEHEYVIERDAGNVATLVPQQETRTRSIINVQTHQEGGKTVEAVTKRELYSTWFLASELATLPAEYTSSKRRLRAVTPALSCLRALWEFIQTSPPGAAQPLPATRDDLRRFTQLATQKHKALRLPPETLRPEFLRAFLQNLGAEVAPVAAVLGGQLAQDVVNVLGQKQQPMQNTVIFDGHAMEALVYALHPEGVLGAHQLSAGGTADLNGNSAAAMSGFLDVGLPMGMPAGAGAGFPVDGNGVAALAPQNAMNLPGGMQQQQQQQQQQVLPQEGVQPSVPVQQPPAQQPVSAPEQLPQDAVAMVVTGQPEQTSGA